MSLLIIEDGTIVDNANSYSTVAELKAFCNLFGLTIPAATLASTTMLEQALIRGTAFVDSEYNFKGLKMSFDDPLEWPRWGVSEMYYYNDIPNGLKNAVCRAAYEEAVSAGILQSNLSSNIKREKIDVIETEYFANSPTKTIYRTIEGFLKGLIQNKNTAIIKRT